MKKLSILALAAIFAIGASAQDTFKQVKKLKDYQEAAKLVKANEANMQAAEAADCYNYLTKLSMERAQKELYTITDNQVQASMKGKISPVDTVAMYTSIYNAIKDAQACDKYDQMPNAKGKVPNKYRKGVAATLYGYRTHLINAGIMYQGKDPNLFFNYLSLYVDSDKFSLFSEQDRSKDENLTQIAYFAAIGAFQLKDYDKAAAYATIAENDPQYSKEATNIRVQAAGQDMKTRQDSLCFADKLKEMIESRPDDETVFTQLTNLYNNLGMTQEAAKLIDTRIAKNPNDYAALVMRGDKYFNEKNWQKALEDFKAACALPDAKQKGNYVPVIAYVGNCYAQIADGEVEANSDNTGNIPTAKVTEIKKIYEQAIEWYQKAKDLDVTGDFKRFYAYPLYNCCYRAFGENDPRTQAAQP